MRPPRPLTVLRLKKLWPHARKKGHEIGEIWRVGYYSKRDGLQCVWLVDNDGNYNWTADPEWIAEMFEVVWWSDETSYYGRNRPLIGPLAPSINGIVLGEQAIRDGRTLSQTKAKIRFAPRLD